MEVKAVKSNTRETEMRNVRRRGMMGRWAESGTGSRRGGMRKGSQKDKRGTTETNLKRKK